LMAEAAAQPAGGGSAAAAGGGGEAADLGAFAIDETWYEDAQLQRFDQLYGQAQWAKAIKAGDFALEELLKQTPTQRLPYAYGKR